MRYFKLLTAHFFPCVLLEMDSLALEYDYFTFFSNKFRIEDFKKTVLN